MRKREEKEGREREMEGRGEGEKGESRGGRQVYGKDSEEREKKEKYLGR